MLFLFVDVKSSNVSMNVNNEIEHFITHDKFGGNDDTVTSAKQKLKLIATQLGECCLTTDLAAIINQKRDLELEIIAKEKIHKKSKNHSLNSNNKEYIEKLRKTERIDIENDDDEEIVLSNSDNLKRGEADIIKGKPILKSDENRYGFLSKNISSQHNRNSSQDLNDRLIFSCDNQSINNDKVYRNYIKIREILSNFILSCLQEYSVEELHLIKINTNLVYSYLLLPSFESTKKKIERKVKIL